MWQRFSIVAILQVAACAHPVTHPRLRAPNPNGCYAIVFEEPSFGGAGDVLNGPARLNGVDQVPGNESRELAQSDRQPASGPCRSRDGVRGHGIQGQITTFRTRHGTSATRSLDLGALSIARAHVRRPAERAPMTRARDDSGQRAISVRVQ